MKAILAVAVLAMAAFAGVMIVGDDADAADSEGYTITYSYNGITAQEKTDADGKIVVKTFKTDVLQSANVPAGYKFDYWVSGSAVYSADKDGSMTTFMGDATLVPHFTPEKSIVKLAYGDKSKEYVDIASADAYSIDLDDLKDFAETIGAKVVGADGQVIDNTVTSISADLGLYIEGYEFKGFFKADDTKVKANELTGAVTSVTTFTAVFEKVYGVSFIVEGASVLETTSDKITVADKIARGDIPVAPAKANYIFMGWYNAADEPVFAYSSDLKQYSVSSEDFKIVEGTVLYAKFVPVNMTVTFQVGEFKSTQTVLYGAKAMKPVLPEGYVAWMLGEEEFNFDTPITENITLTAKAGEVAQIYNITFEIADKAPVIQKSDSMVIPDTAREGYMFQGWVVKGQSQYVDPAELVKTITSDITFVAVYKAVEVVEFTVTFVNGDEVVDTVKVVKDALVDEIDAPEGMFWLFDFETPITGDVTIEAKPLTVTVQFAVGEKIYNAYTQTVAYGEKIDVTKLTDFIFPEGFDSWNYDFNEPVTADMTVYAKAIPEPEEVPPFFQTTEGKCVAVLIAVAIIALIYAVATNMFGLKDALTSFKVTRVKK